MMAAMRSAQIVLASLLAAGAGWGVAGAAPAEDVDVDLELVLAVDGSDSMNRAEQKLQRDGYVAAFRHPEVIEAIGQGRLGRIAATYFEWADQGFQAPVVPWTLISNRAEAEAFADRLAAVPPVRGRGTSISSALFYAVGRFDNPFNGKRLVVDVSGDGPNNIGRPVDETRDFAVSRGITVNGLPVMVSPNFAFRQYPISNLDEYYEECVIGGPGAFMVVVDGMERFEEAVRRKLVLEIAGLAPPASPAVRPIPVAMEEQTLVDCQIGEKARRAWIERPR